MTKKEQIQYRRMYGDKALKAFFNSNRVSSGMNTGTRDMRSNKDYDRRNNKVNLLTLECI